eukprot:15433950-Alexandrium_andersonii.AAC.1
MVSIYGVTDATPDVGARAVTAKLVQSVIAELKAAPRLPCLVAGDLNCEIGLLAELQEATDN